MSQPADDSPSARDRIDPLLLFAEEPASRPAAPANPEISPKTDPVPAPSESGALRARAEKAEQSLRESRREVAALKRQVATLVTAATDNRRSRTGRRSIVAAAAVALLVLVAAFGWQLMPASAPLPVDPPGSVHAAAPAPMPEAQAPSPAVAAAAPLPARAARARDVRAGNSGLPANERLTSQPPTTYFGTLSVDAVPPGGEVFINRKSVGKTPVLLQGLRAGSHLVWIEREGYRLFTRVVLVPANKVSRVSVALEPEDPPAVRP